MVQSSTRHNPFPGLRPFDLDEEHLFFGREGQADELLMRLNRTRFLAVVGTSGSGKSSLVRAGLLPSLYSGFLADASSGWRVAILRPGSAPIRNLAEVLNDPEVFGVEPTSDEAIIRTALTESTLRRGALGLVEVTQQARMEPYENLLVVVDQFEEIFRFKQQAKSVEAEAAAAAFVKLLLAAVGQREVPIFVVLTMRSDFLGDCAQFRDLPEALNESQYLIPRLTRDQLRRAIEGPVAVGGSQIRPQLVNRLLNDVGDNPDQLPILQHALMRTWDYWEDRSTPQVPIDIEHYEATGSMARALSRHADQIYDELPDDRLRYIAEILFKRLTDRGADNREIRRPTQLGEICAVADAELDEVVAVIDAFRAPRRSFLMPLAEVPLSETSVIDISHESLMRNWPHLKAWVAQEDRSATIYRRLAETATLHGQEKANYLRDPELTIGLTWLKEQTPNTVWAERYAPNFDEAIDFLQASAEARDAEAAAKEQSRKREVNRLRTFLAALGGLSLLTGGAAVYAFQQQQEAKEQAQIALTQEAKAEDQRKIAEEQKTEAQNQEKIALAEKDRAETSQREAEDQKRQAEEAQSSEAEQRQLAESNLQRAEEGEAEANRQAGIAQQQTKLATSQTEITRRQTIIAQENEAIAEVATAEAQKLALNSQIQAESLAIKNLLASDLNFEALLRALKLGNRIRASEEITPLSQSAQADTKAIDNNAVVSQSQILPSTRLQAISALREAYYRTGSLEKNTLKGHTGEVWSVSFSPNGQTIATASEDSTVKLWDRQGRELRTLSGHTDRVRSVSFSPDGQTIATASEDSTVKLWDRQGRELRTLSGHTGWVWDVSFSPDGQTIATASGDDTVKLWDRQGRELQTLSGHTGWVWDVSFSPDGRTIATASEDSTVKLWDRQGRELQTLSGHAGEVLNVSFSPDGQTIATASEDSTVKLWNRQGRELQTLSGHTAWVLSVSFSPDGQTIATASEDSTVKLWDRQGRELQTLSGHTGWVWDVSFSPDGQTIATASNDRTVKLWDRQGRELQTLSGHTGWVWGVSFSPDGQTIATASNDSTVKLWDRQGRELQTLSGHTGEVLSVSFSPDGQTIATASEDSTVKLWDRQGRELQTLSGHIGGVSSVSFSPDGQTIATASNDSTVKLWDRQGRELQTLSGHTGAIWGMSFSPDGQTIATASFDSTVKLWDRQGRELQTLSGHTGWVGSVSFSPDGKTLASGSGETLPDGSFGGKAIVWNLDLDDLIAKSCDWLSKYMDNPTTPPEEKALCEDVPAPSQVSTAPAQVLLVSQLQALWGGVRRWWEG